MRRPVQAVIAGLFGALALSCTTGCTVILEEDGQVGFFQESRWGFFHTAKTTHSTSKAQVEAPALVDWVIGDRNDDAPPKDEGPAMEAEIERQGT